MVLQSNHMWIPHCQVFDMTPFPLLQLTDPHFDHETRSHLGIDVDHNTLFTTNDAIKSKLFDTIWVVSLMANVIIVLFSYLVNVPDGNIQLLSVAFISCG